MRIAGRLPVLIITILFFPMGAGAEVGIWRPRLAVPEFAEPGQAFQAEVQADQGLDNAWSAELVNDLDASWSCTVESAQWGPIADGGDAGYVLSIRVPQLISPELFDLRISHTMAGQTLRENAVSIVPDLEAPFYAFHFTDEHIKQQDAVTADGEKSAQMIEWAAPVLALINPRFCAATGDLTETVWSSTTGSLSPYPHLFTKMKSPWIRVGIMESEGIRKGS